jgi:hypothetical protein
VGVIFQPPVSLRGLTKFCHRISSYHFIHRRNDPDAPGARHGSIERAEASGGP